MQVRGKSWQHWIKYFRENPSKILLIMRQSPGIRKKGQENFYLGTKTIIQF